MTRKDSSSRAPHGPVGATKLTSHHHRVVIAGGGFAGVTLAQALERALPPPWEIVVISADNHLVFTPMLPEVVGRTISPLHVVVAGRELTRRTRWLEARIERIDREDNLAHYELAGGEKGSIDFSQLVFACGSVVDLSAIPGLAARGYPLKTLMDALAMGNDLIGNFEAAAAEPAVEARRRLLTTVVIGGGFSGVEVAGHIADLMRAIHGYYPELRGVHPRIVLIQKRDRILPELEHEGLSRFALKKLRENKIDVRLEMSARKVTAQSVELSSGEEIATGMVVCTVGTDTAPLIKALKLPLTKGRLPTDPDMRVSGTRNLWAIGDCALIPNAQTGATCPATAQFAVQQAGQLAKNLGRVAAGRPTTPFSFRPRGLLAAIGHRNAVAEIYGVQLSGFLAWFLWRGVYLWKLPTLGRKIEVAIGWAWSLFFSPNVVQLQLRRSGFPAEPAKGPSHSPSKDP
ncbi:MAG TPA: FAD-dependent oxidoreductase [Opitutaceae bacterium]|nr:FAD-dependent oxidoreductase [Opitutaceae bacterium]